MTQQQLPHIHVDADLFPANDRFERWKSGVGSTFSVALPEGMRPVDFTYSITMWQLGALLVNNVCFGPRSQRRSMRNIRGDQLDHYRVLLQTKGVLRSEVGGRAVSVGPGELLVTDLAQEEVYESDGGSNIVVFIARETLDEMFPRVYDLHGVKPRGAVSQLLADHLLALASSATQIRPESAPALSQAMLGLLAASLMPSAQTLALARPAAEATLLRQINRFIDLHLSDSSLSAETICSNFKLSRSTVYRLYEPQGGVAHYVKERRLACIHAVLSSATGHLHLGRIADDHGFKDASHFSRAFREQYGYSPTEVRSRGTDPLADGRQLAVTSANAGFESWIRSLHD